MTNTRESLLSAAKRLCRDFATSATVDQLVSHFAAGATAFEHGPKVESLPFLGKEFRGHEGLKQYFTVIQEALRPQPLTDKSDAIEWSDWLVDEEKRAVFVKGHTQFQDTKTKQSWEETFCYLLKFDAGAKITSYEVWADPLSAWEARNSH